MFAVIPIAWIAFRELLYERVFYLFAALALASIGVSVLLGQLTYAEHAKLTMDFLLGASQLSMVLFSVFMGISLFQREQNHGSIYLVLSKPISRFAFLFGKFLGQCAVQLLLMLLISALAYGVILRFPDALSVTPIAQCLALIFLETVVISAVTFFFAVNAGVVTASIASLGLFFIGHGTNALDELAKNSESGVVLKMVRSLIPDFEIFNMKSLATYGHTLTATDMGVAVLYAALCTSVFLLASHVTFSRKDLAT